MHEDLEVVHDIWRIHDRVELLREHDLEGEQAEYEDGVVDDV